MVPRLLEQGGLDLWWMGGCEELCLLQELRAGKVAHVTAGGVIWTWGFASPGFAVAAERPRGEDDPHLYLHPLTSALVPKSLWRGVLVCLLYGLVFSHRPILYQFFSSPNALSPAAAST